MIIIKYYEWLKIQPDLSDCIYELCTEDFKKIRQLKKDEARAMIRDNNLVLVHKNKYGAIWR